MVRTLMAVAAAWIVSVIVMAAFQALAMSIPVNPMDLQSPLVRFSMSLVLFGDLFGAIAGGYVAGWISPKHPMRALWITTLFLVVLRIVTLVLPSEEPVTLVGPLSLFVIPLGVLLGGKIRLEIAKKSASASGADTNPKDIKPEDNIPEQERS